MLFDLQGKRRRVVQGTYLTLAVLMGGGLVLFGVGGDVQGGLLDAFKNDNGGGSADKALQKQIDRYEKRAAANPKDSAALAKLVRVRYSAASSQIPQGSTDVPKGAAEQQRAAARDWKRYVAATDNPSKSLARVAIQLFGPPPYGIGITKSPNDGKKAALIVAENSKSSADWINVVVFASAAKDTRTSDLAGQKALDVAPKAERKQVRAALKQAKSAPITSTQQQQGASGG